MTALVLLCILTFVAIITTFIMILMLQVTHNMMVGKVLSLHMIKFLGL